MSRKLACYCAVVLMLAFSACAAPAVSPTETLPPAPTMTETETPQPSATHRPTETFTPEPTITETPWPLPTFSGPCGTVTLGTPGTQSQDKTHPVLVQGTSLLCNIASADVFNFVFDPPRPQSRLDLDTGSPGFAGADLFFFVPGRGMFLYGPVAVNGAQSMGWSRSYNDPQVREPTFDECKNLSSLFANDNQDIYVCMITNQGHVARIKLEELKEMKREEGLFSLRISFITWNIIGNTPTPFPRP